MTVKEMLSRITSRELAEWEAYERLNGPVGDMYIQEMLAQLNERMNFSTHVFGAQFDENPIPAPESVPSLTKVLRPNELVVANLDGELIPGKALDSTPEMTKAERDVAAAKKQKDYAGGFAELDRVLSR